MKKILLIGMVLSFFLSANSQNVKTDFSKEKLMKSYGDNACKCIDSIDTYNKTPAEIAKDISNCIDKQTSAYQMTVKIMESLDLNNLSESGGKKSKEIIINTNQDSKEYKEYYYELERYLTDNCKSLKDKVNQTNKLKKNSVSDNPDALKWYRKGDDASKNEDYNKALKNYKKAVEIDPNFAFAWDNIGLCNRKLGNYNEALDAYKKSLEIDSTGMMPLQNIGVVYTYMKDYENAIKSYERLKELDKNNPEIYYGIGQIYYEFLKDYEKGLDYMCKAYNIYVEQKSPYRTDAEKIIQYIYTEMKKTNDTAKFNQILKDNNITPLQK